jgi:hypothetical protein
MYLHVESVKAATGHTEAVLDLQESSRPPCAMRKVSYVPHLYQKSQRLIETRGLEHQRTCRKHLIAKQRNSQDNRLALWLRSNTHVPEEPASYLSYPGLKGNHTTSHGSDTDSDSSISTSRDV